MVNDLAFHELKTFRANYHKLTEVTDHEPSLRREGQIIIQKHSLPFVKAWLCRTLSTFANQG